VQLRNISKNAKDQFKWKWSKGDLYFHSQLGSPTDTDTYAVCVYDSTADVPTLVSTVVINPSNNWFDKNPKGFKYKDTSGLSNGVQQVKLLPGAANRSKVMIKAKGANIPMPIPTSDTRYFNQNSEVVVQLVNTSGVCWTSSFTAASTKKNTSTLFSATVR